MSDYPHKDSLDMTSNETDEEIILLAIHDLAIENRDLRKKIRDLQVQVENLQQHLADNDLAFEHSQEVIKKQEETIEKLQQELAASKLKWQTGKPPKDG